MIAAWFAILFTGRYPRGLFGFVEGVMRWDNRVTAYAWCWSPTIIRRSAPAPLAAGEVGPELLGNDLVVLRPGRRFVHLGLKARGPDEPGAEVDRVASWSRPCRG